MKPMCLLRALPLSLVFVLIGCTANPLDPGSSAPAGPTPGDASQRDTFACGSVQCDAKTEYCYETFICIAEVGVDLAGANPQTSCRPIPTQCLGKSEKDGCSCTLQSLGGTDGPDPLAGSGITPDESAPAGTCTLAQNCV
jgi:hypothetical protein